MRREYGIESYWNFQFSEALILTADIQVVFDPAYVPNRTEAVIFGTRFRLVF